MPPMNRREAVKAATALVGGVLITSNGFLIACSRDSSKPAGKVLTIDDQSLIEEIADTLLPTTPSSPGAKAAGAGAAINLLLSDCYEQDAQDRVVNGLKEFRQMCRKRCGDSFASLPQKEREKVLREIDAEAQKAGPTHYFGLVRELALRAYFSSEVGMTKALRYVMVPGKWVGCVPLAPGQPAWA
ncbi:MAG TPA: gluconate 2-dehydrogenase subunit 3 family protein [Gemmatimonadaceae bacterium]|nr:gluconate 2-dehydrogenase subunit 3 family protein [Gemmatimonadaceae bacterium]